MSYKHGIYSDLIPSSISITSGSNIPVYVGTAPVHRLSEWSEYLNKPLLISGLEDAYKKLGYNPNDDFEEFTLSGVVYAHFSNSINPIGPIVVINVLDPDKHKATEETTKSLILINGIGALEDDVILDSIEIDGKTAGTHYKVSYSGDGKALVESIGNGLTSPVQVSYIKIDASKVVATDIIGTYNQNEDTLTGLKCIDTLYEELNVIPAILSAPGFNHIQEVEKALTSSCTKIGGRWEAICVTDIDPEEETIDKAIAWKEDKGYVSIRNKVCWPKGRMGTRDMFMSILTIVRMMQTDYIGAGVPYETPSNKQIDIVSTIASDKMIRINLTNGNKLNEKGITTAIYNGGKYVLWGPHMANFKYGTSIKVEDMFDSNIRMNLYLLNDFQLRNTDIVDTPMSRNDVDALIHTEQSKLNALVADGKLLYGKFNFLAKNNTNEDIMSGDFTFDTAVTNTPPGKSLTNRIQYTSQGIDTL